MPQFRTPQPGESVTKMREIWPSLRPEVEAAPMTWFTGRGYKPRRNPDSPDHPDAAPIWWCLCCDTRLGHSRSGFCDIHRLDYNRQRRRIRDEANHPVRVARSTVEQIHQLIHRIELAKATRADRDHYRKQRLSEADKARVQAEWELAVQEHTLATRALLVLLQRELPIAGDPPPPLASPSAYPRSGDGAP